jgi:hypothetical protein
LAIAFCEASTVNQGTLKKLRDIEKQFKNAVGIVIGINDDELWTSFQMTAELSTMSLFRVATTAEAADFAQQCHKELSNKEKFDLQTAYFNKERELIASTTTARSVLMNTFQQLDIPAEDAEIMLDGFPTVRQLINATEADLIESSPASLESIKKVAAFFQEK